MKFLRQTPWSRIRWQNSVYKDLSEIVHSGKPTGSVLKETIAVSVTISISVQKQHSQILLRSLLRGRMRENHREPEVPEAKVPVEECFDSFARITSKEFAPIHSVKNDILQKMLDLQVGEWMHGGKVLPCASSGWWTALQKVQTEWWRKCSGYVENYLTIGLRISGHGAAEVCIDFAEELKHTETNPTC